MNKDAILASIIGFGIGLVITGGVIFGPKIAGKISSLTKSGQVQSATTSKLTTPSPTKMADASALTITSPLKDAIVNDGTLTVSGTAPKNATVIVGSLDDESVVETHDSLNYQTKVALKEGKNEISVTGIVNNQPTTQQITVYYTPNN